MPEEKKKPDKKKEGKSFLERLLARFPEDKRAGISEVLLADEVLDEVGEAILMKADYSRGMQEVAENRARVQTWKEKLDEHWQKVTAERAQEQAEIARLRGGRGDNGDDDDEDEDDPKPKPKSKPPAAQPGLTRADLEAARESFRAEGSQLAAVLIPLAANHQKEFDEVLDVDALYQHCRASGLPIDRGGYESFVKEKRSDAAEKRRAKELEEAREAGRKEGLEKAREELSATPLGGPPAFAGTLSGLTRKETKDSGSRAVVDRAVATFNKLKSTSSA